MPALDVLKSLPDDWRLVFDEALPRAREAAKRLPLVRVVVPKHPKRGQEEIRDVFISGRLLRAHKSKGTEKSTASIEKQLGVADSLYFHAGRPHEEYGDAIFVISDIASPIEATPFGLGQLLCDKKGGLHEKRRCLAPISHAELSKQRDFFHASIWKTDWRERAAEYLALYFGFDLEGYFMEGDKGKPQRKDPELIYTNSSDNKDWRAWTIEIRVLDDVSLFNVLEHDRLLYWAMKKKLESEIATNGWSMKTFYPSLPKRLRAKPNDDKIYEDITQKVKEFVLL